MPDIQNISHVQVENGGVVQYSRSRSTKNCDDEYTPSATAGDYSPSNPWDAPGMSVRDFI